MNRLIPRRRGQPRFDWLEERTLQTASTSAVHPSLTRDPVRTVLVRFADQSSPEARTRAFAAWPVTVNQVYPDGLTSVSVAGKARLSRVVRSLQAQPGVVYAEANSTFRVELSRTVLNDSGYSQLWGLDSPNDVDIDAPEAWSITTGSPSTIVAVIDTGIDLNNPDLRGRIWTNPQPGVGGFRNDLHGWNFVNNTPDVQDDDGHGTHVSAVIGAAANNSYGVTGIDWNARIMPLKFLDARGDGTVDQAVSAIYYAVSHGARVINASWGGGSYSRSLRDAIAFANTRGVVFVTAAGNQGASNDFRANYPATETLANVISVAAVDRSGNLADFSNYGKTVDIAAPGVDIVSLVPTTIERTGVAVYSGTSMATAYVSGVVSLLVGLHPELSAADLVNRVVTTAKPLPGLTGRMVGSGIVDAALAVSAGSGTVNSTPPVVSPGGPAQGVTETMVRSAILASDEFLKANGGTSVGYVTALYRNLLGRGGDPSGLMGWSNALDQGLTSRDQVARAILESPEGRQVQVARWYQDDLGRTQPISELITDPGVQAWAGLLLAGRTESEVETMILAAPEALSRYGPSPSDWVAGWYLRLTGRDASASELAAWSNAIVAGTTPVSVVSTFLAAPEVKATKVAHWYQVDLGRSAKLAQLKVDPGVLIWSSYLG